MSMADDNTCLRACMDASSWMIADGRIDGRHVFGLRLRPLYAAQLELDPVLTFQFDPETMRVSGAMIDGTPIDYSEDTELPFGEPGSPSHYERSKSNPLLSVACLLPSAIAVAKHAADPAAGDRTELGVDAAFSDG